MTRSPSDSGMTCDRFVEVLMDLLEGDADARTATAASGHAAACAECGSLLGDLQRLRDDAARLPIARPSRDLWAGIEERIAAPVVSLRGRATSTGAATDSRPGHITRRSAMLAAAGLVLVTAGVTYVATRAGAPDPVAVPPVAGAPQAGPVVATLDPAPAVPDQPAPVSPVTATVTGENRGGVSAPVRTAAATPSPTALPTREGTPLIAVSAGPAYDAEIARLRAIVDAQRPRLDTATIGVIDRNLRLIDDAIIQVRNALSRDPASRFLMESLSSVYERKMQLLRSAAALEGSD